MPDLKTYQIINDSGVDYKFLGGFGHKEKWLGQLVKGSEASHLKDHLTVEKPFGIPGTYTSHKSNFKEVTDHA